jgi:hypothetical protein
MPLVGFAVDGAVRLGVMDGVEVIDRTAADPDAYRDLRDWPIDGDVARSRASASSTTRSKTSPRPGAGLRVPREALDADPEFCAPILWFGVQCPGIVRHCRPASDAITQS